MKLYSTQGNEARLRRAPDHKSEVIATLPEGTEIEEDLSELGTPEGRN